MKFFVVTKDGELYKPITKYYTTKNKATASLISHLETIVWKKGIYKDFPDEKVKNIVIRDFLPEFEILEFTTSDIK